MPREAHEGVTGVGDATLNGRELAVAQLPHRPRHPLPDRPRRAPDRGHLAVPLQGRLLAARPGDHDAPSPRSTWRCGTSRPRSPACRSTSCSAAASRTGVMVYGHANGATIERHHRRGAALRRAGLQGRSALQSGVPGLTCTYGVVQGHDVLRAGRRRPADRERLVDREVPAPPCPSCSRRAREALGWDVHLLHDVHHRLTPIEAAPARQGPGALPPVLAGGRDAGREPGRVPPDPPAHHHAARRRRGLQHDLGLQAADRGAADRLHPRDRGPRRRHHPPAPHRRPGRRSTTCAPAATARPTCRRCAWARRCTSTCRCPTSASRNTCATPPETDAVFPHAYTFARRHAAPGRGARASASTSTRSWRPSTPTSAPTCR